MKRKVTVVDYGSGNILSVMKALEHVGAEVTLTTSPDGIETADRLVLPGVGSFAGGINQLLQLGLVESLQAFAQVDRPMLGICLGMQLFLDLGQEFGTHPGLGLMPGCVVPIPTNMPDGSSRRVPHIGWNELLPAEGKLWNEGLLTGIAPGAAAYFVHSYFAQLSQPSHCVAESAYEGILVPAIIQRDYMFGCQFHPEKSGPVGLRLIRNFIEL